MDQKECEINGLVENAEEPTLALQTPQKMDEPLRTETKLIDKYKDILEMFDHMTCSLRLLHLCRKCPTFRNVSTQLEVIGKRKLLYSHLAQIAYILPEVFKIDKLLVHDKETLCMRLDMKITLRFDAIDMHHEQSCFMSLRKLFVSRVVDFFAAHPQAYVVPEAMLPEPFHQGGQINHVENILGDSVVQAQSTAEVGISFEASSLPQSSGRHSYQKVVIPKSEETHIPVIPTILPSSSCIDMNNQEFASKQEEHVSSICPEIVGVNNQSISIKPEEEPPHSSKSASAVLSIESPSVYSSIDCVAGKSPVASFPISGGGLMVDTPVQLTPKRLTFGRENNVKPKNGENCSSCHKPAKRSLNFSALGGDSTNVGGSETCTQAHDNSSPTMKLVEEKNVSDRAAVFDQERSHLCEDQSSSLACSRMRQGISSCLPGIAITVNYIFQTVSCSSITREELVHKIMMHNYEILDRNEAEEQVELLEKIVPDWFCRRLTSSGDTIYSIGNGSNLESVMSRLITS